VKRQQNLGNIEEMTLSYPLSSTCWKLKHGEQNGKEQLTKQMNGWLGDGQMQR
jgi:hypothetical protein